MKIIYNTILISTAWLLCSTLQSLAAFSQQQPNSSKNKFNQTPKKMTTPEFTITLLVDQTPKEVFNAINHVRGWWSEEIEGGTAKLNDEFTYHYEDLHYCQMKLTEVVPNKKVVWFVKYNYFKFTKDKTEWTGTTISFDITEKNGKTQLRFTHHGLVPEFECYNICSNAWSHYIQQSLLSLITTGKGLPNGTGKPATADEKKLGTAMQ